MILTQSNSKTTDIGRVLVLRGAEDIPRNSDISHSYEEGVPSPPSDEQQVRKAELLTPCLILVK